MTPPGHGSTAAALRCRSWEPAGRNVGRIRHLCRHPAQVWSLKCPPAALRLPVLVGPTGRNVGRIRHLCRHPAWSAPVVARLSVAPAGNARQRYRIRTTPQTSRRRSANPAAGPVPLTFAVCSLSTAAGHVKRSIGRNSGPMPMAMFCDSVSFQPWLSRPGRNPRAGSPLPAVECTSFQKYRYAPLS